MVKFYKVDHDSVARQAHAIRVQLQLESEFSNSITQREEVIICVPHEGEDVLQNAKEAAELSPESRVLILFDDNRDLTADLAHQIGKQIMDFAGKNDTQDFIEKVDQLFSKKKDYAFYTKQEPAEVLHARVENGYAQLDGLKNNIIVGKSKPIVKSLQMMAAYKAYMERIQQRNLSLGKDKKLDEQITLLITGENGSGKGELARVWSANFQDRNYVEHNMAGLSDELFASELFGSKKGAYTGSVADVDGMLKSIGKGIGVLDEFGDISLQSQTKLLRFLQQKEYQRVGDHQIYKFEGQVILATNKDLPKAVKEGTFREDLYYRIKPFHIHMPALRERREDIDLIASVLLEKHGHGHSLTTNAVDLLVQQSWPGNVRQLEGFIQNLCIHNDGIINSDRVREMMLIQNQSDNQFNTTDLKKTHVIEEGKLSEHQIRTELLEKASERHGFVTNGNQTLFYEALREAFKNGAANEIANGYTVKMENDNEVTIQMGTAAKGWTIEDTLNVIEVELYHSKKFMRQMDEKEFEQFRNAKEGFLTINEVQEDEAAGNKVFHYQTVENEATMEYGDKDYDPRKEQTIGFDEPKGMAMTLTMKEPDDFAWLYNVTEVKFYQDKNVRMLEISSSHTNEAFSVKLDDVSILNGNPAMKMKKSIIDESNRLGIKPNSLETNESQNTSMEQEAQPLKMNRYNQLSM